MLMLEGVAEVIRVVRENTWKDRSSDGLIEMDINPTVDIGLTYIFGVPGVENLDRGRGKKIESGGLHL